jgi:hypothetical protein
MRAVALKPSLADAVAASLATGAPVRKPKKAKPVYEKVTLTRKDGTTTTTTVGGGWGPARGYKWPSGNNNGAAKGGWAGFTHGAKCPRVVQARADQIEAELRKVLPELRAVALLAALPPSERKFIARAAASSPEARFEAAKARRRPRSAQG